MKLSVIIPVYNERDTVLELLSRVQAVEIDKEVLVVDNCSTDGTRELLDQLGDPAVQVLHQPVNYGKGTSVRAGIRRARGDYLIVQDADLEYDPEDYHKILDAAESNGWPAVFGSRLMEAAPDYEPSRMFRFGRVWMTRLFRLLYRADVTDVATCYKLMRTDLVQRLDLVGTGFDLDFESPAKLCKAGIPIHEVPISYHPRSIEQGKKIRARDGLRAARILLKYRFVN